MNNTLSTVYLFAGIVLAAFGVNVFRYAGKNKKTKDRDGEVYSWGDTVSRGSVAENLEKTRAGARMNIAVGDKSFQQVRDILMRVGWDILSSRRSMDSTGFLIEARRH